MTFVLLRKISVEKSFFIAILKNLPRILNYLSLTSTGAQGIILAKKLPGNSPDVLAFLFISLAQHNMSYLVRCKTGLKLHRVRRLSLPLAIVYCEI